MNGARFAASEEQPSEGKKARIQCGDFAADDCVHHRQKDNRSCHPFVFVFAASETSPPPPPRPTYRKKGGGRHSPYDTCSYLAKYLVTTGKRRRTQNTNYMDNKEVLPWSYRSIQLPYTERVVEGQKS